MGIASAEATAAQQRIGFLRSGLRLEYFTVLWNSLEAIVGIVIGLSAGSIAVLGFALQSVVESSSGLVLVWRLRSESSGKRSSEEAEKRAVRAVAIAFFALALYVGGQSIYDLITKTRPEETLPGMILTAVSLVVMPVLATRKRSVAKSLDSRSLQADSTQTKLCVYLSAAVLVGLALNAGFGWWWADPLAALAIAAVAANEGQELWRTEDFCCV
jgi:divalent metal cation (Fe/Co/Zn/Cd) transporter